MPSKSLQTFYPTIILPHFIFHQVNQSDLLGVTLVVGELVVNAGGIDDLQLRLEHLQADVDGDLPDFAGALPSLVQVWRNFRIPSCCFLRVFNTSPRPTKRAQKGVSDSNRR